MAVQISDAVVSAAVEILKLSNCPMHPAMANKIAKTQMIDNAVIILGAAMAAVVASFPPPTPPPAPTNQGVTPASISGGPSAVPGLTPAAAGAMSS